MEKHLLPKVERYFKTNLHTHTTISDGQMEPADVKAMYKDLGYSVLCITDHNVVVDHSNLNDPDFLMLTGLEVNHNHENYRPRYDGQVYHLNLIAKRPDLLWAPSEILRKYPGAAPYEDLVDYAFMDRSYNIDSVNAMIAKANEKGFLVMYNHPAWSCQTYLDYAPLKGLWGIELRNNECYRQGNDADNSQVFKDLMNLGNRIYPVGTDDMHKPAAAGGAWIMVGAEKLTYECVIDALEKGDFYMSCGPEIHSLTIEDNILRIRCTDAQKITLLSHGRFARSVFAEGKEGLNEAEFDLTTFKKKADGDNSLYIRLHVLGMDGTYAATRAYYLDEL